MKTNLKKLLLVCLMLVMFVSVSVTAFADTGGVYLSVKETYCVGKDILVTAKADAGLYPDAWVGFYSKTENPGDSSSYYWYHVNREGNAVNHESCVLQNMNWGGKQDSDDPIPVGEYTLYLFENYSHDEILSMDVEIKECADNDNDGFCDNCGEDLRKIIDSGNCGEYGYTLPYVLYDDGELIIKGNGPIKERYFDTLGYKYEYKDYIKNVVIENGVTAIGAYSFYDCSNLTTVELPDSVISIGNAAFYECSSLKDVSLSEGLISIGKQAFGFCGSLEDIVISGSIKVIDEYAFNYCSGLKKIDVIGDGASIGKQVFDCCVSLEEVKLEGVESIGANAFYECPSLKDVSLSDGLISIGEYAFAENDSLVNIVIPDSVETIGEGCFYYCANLQEVILSESLTQINSKMFTMCQNLKTVKVPYGIETICEEAFDNCGNLEDVEIPESVTRIEKSAFYRCYNMKSNGTLKIPESVTYIGEEAFALCGFREVILPNNLITLSDEVFKACGNLKSITIPESVTTIGAKVFNQCPIEAVVVPVSVESIGEDAFSCSAMVASTLKTIKIMNPECEIYDSIDTIGYSYMDTVTIYGYANSTAQAYAEKYNKKFIPICDHLNTEDFEGEEATCTEEGYTAGTYCYDCETWISGHEVISLSDHKDENVDKLCDVCGEDLRKIIDSGYCDEYSTTNIPYVLYDDGELVISGEGAIRDNCFYYNSDQISNSYKYSSYIKNVAIEAGVTKIGNSAFAGCENLTTVTLPDGLSVIGSSAFANTKIESIVIPNSVTSAMWAFNSCSTLKKAIFEEGITCIPVSIFNSCISLEEVVIPKGVTCVNANAFYWCKGLKSVTLPESITEIGTGAFQYCSNLEYINIPDGVEIIPLWAFDGASLKSINLENIKEVGEMAFTSCDFTELNIPASLTTIGPEAFRFCDLLEEINVDEANPNYSSEDGVLFNKDKTEILMYPASNERAFYTIPDSVATIREYAFGQSKNLESVIIPDSVETIYYWVFEETENIKNIVVPESVKTVMGGAFCCNNLEKILFLNPDCEINDYELTISESAVISGYKDSTAQAYAEMHNRKFEVYCPHNNTEEFEGKEATCTEGGYTAGTYCSDCETWLSGHDVIAVSGHTADNAVKENEVAATCTTEGSYEEVVYCSACGIEMSRTTVMVGVVSHNYEPVVTAPTCTEGGFTTYTCVACGDSYIDDEVAPLSHTADEAVKENEVAATCGKEGSYEEVVYCSACGSEIARTTVSVPALSHNYESVVVEPTCDKDGYTEHTCTNCGDTYTTDETPALGHTDADGDGVCDGCGYKEPCMIKFLNWLRAFLEKLIKFFQSIGDYT